MRAGVEQNSSATSTYSVFDVPFLRTIGDELVDLRVLLELELWPEVHGGGCEGDLDLREVRVGDLEVHIAPQFEVVQATVADHLRIDVLPDDDMHAV